MTTKYVLLVIIGIAIPVWARAQDGGPAAERVELGRLATGATVSFSHAGTTEEWTLETGGTPRIVQERPIVIEVFRTEEDIRQLSAGYRALNKVGESVEARGEITYGDTVRFYVLDRWTLSGAILSVRRRVEVIGNSPGGFYSSLLLTTASGSSWDEAEFFVPGLMYTAVERNKAALGNATTRKRHYEFREDCLSAPMFGIWFGNGASLTVLNPSPRGDTTDEDSRPRVSTVLLDERFRFGAFGASQTPGGVEFGYRYPGSLSPGEEAAAGSSGFGINTGMLRRYHRIRNGFVQEYQLAFRFAQKETYPQMMKNSWRWAWQTLNPPVYPLDVDLVRKVLLDHLADRVTTIDGRTGIPWIFQTTTGMMWNRPDDRRAAMGFVGKNLEAADQLLREGDRDKTERGQRMRKLGLAIIESFVRLVPMSLPGGEGFDLETGELTVSFPPSSWRGNLQAGMRVFVRAPSEDMRMLMEAYHREKAQGRDHPDWLQWCRQFADWLLTQQRSDGSFPRAWRPGTGEVVEPSGTSSYAPVPLLVMLSRETGQNKYTEAAIRAADYIWSNFGAAGAYVGGTLDNPDVIDKEAGMLSLEAFLALFESTHDRKWLAYAQGAADFAETWIWIWNVPMPEDADNAVLHWKKGVPTVGLQGIAVRVAGGCDEYMDWSTPAYAKLYKYSQDEHDLDVARVLLHDTKAMLALPARTYDLHGPGWQQEHWSLGPPHRGYGGHRGWLPWVSTNHLFSIVGLEQFDPVLFQQLSRNPSGPGKPPQE